MTDNVSRRTCQRIAVALSMLALIAGLFAACQPPSVPATVTAAECIAKDAIAGADVATIAKDCGVDVAQVLVSLLDKRVTDQRVLASKARSEALDARRAMGIDGGP